MSNLLLDSNAVVEYAAASPRFGRKTIRLLNSSQLYFSSITLAELKLKELKRPGYRSNLDSDKLANLGLIELPYQAKDAEHMLEMQTNDTFDIILVAQAISRQMRFVTADLRILRSGLDFVIDLTD
ncbi:MAG TPA: PIN domain-containing protein [Aquiluna sp.]